MGLVDQLVGIAAQPTNIDIGKNLNQGMEVGAKLAMHAETVADNRAKLAAKQMELKNVSLEKVGTWFDQASKMPDGSAKKAFVSDFIPKGINALGLSDTIDPTSLKMLQGNPELASYMRGEVQAGRMTTADITAATQDPEKLAKLIPDASRWKDLQTFQTTAEGAQGNLEADQKFALEEARKLEVAKIAAAAQGAKAGTFQQGVDVKKDALAKSAVHDINNNPGILKIKNQGMQIQTDLHTLDNPKGVTWAAYNEVMLGGAAAMSGGNVSSDFKAKEIQNPQWAKTLAKAREYASSNPNQLVPPQDLEYGKAFMNRLDVSYQHNISAAAKQLGKSVKSAYAHVPNAAQAADQAIESLSNGSWANPNGEKRVEISGRMVPESEAKAFLAPNSSDSPAIAAAKAKKLKELGL